MMESSKVQKRQVAYKVAIKDVLSGEYVRNEGDWMPNYVVYEGKNISRVNIIAVVLVKASDEQFKTIIIDDGTGKISVRSFEGGNGLEKLEVGEPVMVIGRIREFGSERYIVPEIVRKISDPGWIKVRKAELECSHDGNVEEKNDVVVEDAPEPGSDKIFNLIKESDTGSGADFDDIISKSGDTNAEKLINHMLQEGDIFEVKPGKLKVLE